MSPEPRVEVLAGERELHERFAAVVSGGLRDAVAASGRASLALSRGTEAFRVLAASNVPWAHVHVFQVDERAARDGSEERNLTAIERELSRIPPPGPRIYAMPVAGDLAQGAADYSGELDSVCGSPPVLDVVHLGLGPDGHTASLFPGDQALEVRDASVVVSGLREGFHRLTLTLPVLVRSRLVVFLVAGRAKAEAVRSFLAPDHATPAARVRSEEVHVLLDREAASLVR